MLKNQKRQPEENPFATAMILLPTAVLIAIVVFKADLTRMIFGEISPVKQASIKSAVIEKVESPQIQAKETTNGIRPESPQSENIMIGAIYRYTDENGVLAMVDSPDKVPNRYKANMKVSGGFSNAEKTPVIIRNNKISVPVSIGYQGKTINVRLFLDTGATGIVISTTIAQQLGIRPNDTRRGNSTIANGMTVAHYNITADHVTVGPKTKRNIELSVLPQVGNEEISLLGMSFLREFPHMIDVKSQVIKWM